MTTSFTLIALFSALLTAGCSDHSMMGALSAPHFAVSPKDGEAGVSRDAVITLEFSHPVDRGIIERNVHLISDVSLADSLCPLGGSMTHGSMEMAMMDSHTMNHLIDVHSLGGRFEWNDAGTRCTFNPVSELMPDMRYMIHMGSGMMRMMESRMGMMGGNGIVNDGMNYHFETADMTDN